MALGDPGIQPVDIDVEFLNKGDRGPSPDLENTPVPFTGLPTDLVRDPRTPLNDQVDENNLYREQQQYKRDQINPEIPRRDVPPAAWGNKMVELRREHPGYSDLSDRELVDKLHAKFYPDMEISDLEAKIGHDMSPATQAIGEHIGHAIIGVYDDIKKFMESGDEQAAFRLAATLATSGTAFAQKNSVGVFGSHLKANQKEYIKELHEQGKTSQEIADVMTRYHTAPGVEMTAEQVEGQIRRLGLKANGTKKMQWTDAMAYDLKAYDAPVLGVRPTFQHVIEAMQKKYPEASASMIQNRLTRNRSLAQFKEAEAPFGKKLNEDTGLKSDTISKPEGQLEFEFQFKTPEQQQQSIDTRKRSDYEYSSGARESFINIKDFSSELKAKIAELRKDGYGEQRITDTVNRYFTPADKQVSKSTIREFITKHLKPEA